MRRILGVQALRGLAALSIAVLHISQAAGWFTGQQGVAPYAWMRRVPWEAGVDVFFVISGFVIVYASADLFGRAGAVREFLGRRVARIVPLYWLVTSLLILAALLRLVPLHDALGDGAPYVTASYAFFPWKPPGGAVLPVFRPGWTLEYEMLFYGVVALFLALRLRLALPLIAAAIAGLAAANALWHPRNTQLDFWTDPIVLEFGYGVALAAL
ncbi:MAG: acyltransferase family protein, partial [Acetobacteraceae bacterium]